MKMRRLGELWDYAMRQKTLLLVLIGISILTGLICGKVFSEKVEDSPVIDIPNTGTAIIVPECNNWATCQTEFGTGSGANNIDDEISTVASVAAKDDNILNASESFGQIEVRNESKTELIIAITGITAAMLIILGAIFAYDRYMR